MSNQPAGAALSDEEIQWVIEAFLRHPNRLKFGASEEEILSVLKWTEELKLRAAVELAMLHGVYNGDIVLDIRHDDGEVVMSNATIKPVEKRNPEKYLDVQPLIMQETGS